MTVNDLIDMLKTIKNKKRIVILQRDPEGNGFAPADDGVDDNAVWYSEDEDVGIEKLTKENRKDGYTEDDVREGEPAVILWPTR